MALLRPCDPGVVTAAYVAEKLGGIEINRIAGKDDEHHYCAVITLRANKKQMDEDVIKEINGIEDVLAVEEL